MRVGELHIRVRGREHRFPDPRIVRIGRDPASDVVLEDATVSRLHATFEPSSHGWVFRDAGSTHGSYLEDGEQTGRLVIAPGRTVRLRLGDAMGDTIEVEALDELREVATGPPSQAVTQLGRLSGVHRLVATRVRIGRDPDNDLVLEDLQVSRRHAELLGTGERWELRDLGSHNGTYVNGRPVTTAELSPGDVIGIGAHVLRFTGDRLDEYLDQGAAWLLALGVTVTVGGGRTILSDVSFPLEPSSLLAVVGPSGAGKTTLLGALTGSRPATAGSVVYGGRDLYAAYAELQSRMGYVPQEDVLHRQLRVSTALEYAAKLRFPPDVPAADRSLRVAEVLAELNLTERAGARIDTLSGGQRKRVSVALELLTRPALLFLDEPTSGLDPGNEEQLMQLLRKLADGGRTVIVVTHSVQSIDVCDRVLFLAPGGTTAFFGPPAEVLPYFGSHGDFDRYSEVFRAIDEHRDRSWSDLFRAAPLHERYVAGPLGQAGVAPAPGDTSQPEEHRQRETIRQMSVLTRRAYEVLWSDRRNTFLLAAQAPVFGLLFALRIGPDRMSTSHGAEATMLLWLLVIGATWLGTANAIREIVKEQAVFRRERAMGLSVLAYVGSKVLLLAPLTLLQTTVMTLIATSGQDLPAVDPSGLARIEGAGAVLSGQRIELVVVVGVAGLAAMAVGLLISAIVRSSDRAMALLPVVLIAQVVVSVPFFATRSAVLDPVGVVSSAQWAMAASASTTDLNDIRSVDLAVTGAGRSALVDRELPANSRRAVASAAAGRERWDHTGGVWLRDMGAALLLTVGALTLAVIVLQRRDPVRSAGREKV